MSYRLIDANAIASQRPEVNDMPCVYADLPSGLDGGYYDMRESDELQRENVKLRKLVDKLLYGINNELTPADVLVWTQEANTMLRELGADESFEATLGRGTCYLISAPQYGEGCQECSACGEVLDGYLFDGGHCPNCGAKVVN